jgi:hypothetical protein
MFNRDRQVCLPANPVTVRPGLPIPSSSAGDELDSMLASESPVERSTAERNVDARLTSVREPRLLLSGDRGARVDAMSLSIR